MHIQAQALYVSLLHRTVHENSQSSDQDQDSTKTPGAEVIFLHQKVSYDIIERKNDMIFFF